MYCFIELYFDTVSWFIIVWVCTLCYSIMIRTQTSLYWYVLYCDSIMQWYCFIILHCNMGMYCFIVLYFDTVSWFVIVWECSVLCYSVMIRTQTSLYWYMYVLYCDSIMHWYCIMIRHYFMGMYRYCIIIRHSYAWLDLLVTLYGFVKSFHVQFGHQKICAGIQYFPVF